MYDLSATLETDMAALFIGFAHKACDVDGNWFRHPMTNKTWTNYTTCIDVNDYEVT